MGTKRLKATLAKISNSKMDSGYPMEIIGSTNLGIGRNPAAIIGTNKVIQRDGSLVSHALDLRVPKAQYSGQ